MTTAPPAAANASPRLKLRPQRIVTIMVIALLLFDSAAKFANVPAMAPVSTLIELATSLATIGLDRSAALINRLG